MTRIRLAVRLERLAGVVAQDLHRAPGLTHRLGQRLALFTSEIPTDLLGALIEVVGGLTQDVAAGRRWQRAPGRERTARRFDGLGGRTGVGLMDLRNNLRRAGRIAVGYCRAAVAPGAANIRTQLRCHGTYLQYCRPALAAWTGPPRSSSCRGQGVAREVGLAQVLAAQVMRVAWHAL